MTTYVNIMQRHITRPLARLTIILGIIIAAVIGTTHAVMAQNSNARVLVHYGETSDSGGGLGLNLYFTLVDINEHVLPMQLFHSGSVVLDDGTQYPVQVGQPTNPLYVVLALDVGGSMTGSSAQMLQAAAQMVSSSPAQTQFSLLTFEQSLTTLIDFSANADHNAVIKAINAIKVPAITQGTCMYDAAVLGLNMLAKTSQGRRALVLFTDGLDVKLVGGGPCSKSTYNDVITLATNPSLRTPIHTIAMQGNPNASPNVFELQSMANSTGGLWETGTRDQLASLFSQVASGLSQQMVASTILYPKKGSHGVSLFVTLSDNSPARPDGTKIIAPNDYARPAGAATPLNGTTAPGTIGITSIQADPSTHLLTIKLQIQGTIPASEYRFLLKNAETNLLVGEYPFSVPLPNPIKLPIDTLTSGQYVLSVNAIGADGLIISRSPDTADNKFAYIIPTAPPTATATATATVAATATPSLTINVQMDTGTNELVINIQASNTDLISRYQLELTDIQTNLVTNSLLYNAPPYDVIRVPLSKIAAGKYTLALTALDTNSQPLTRTQINISYNPPTVTPTAAASPTPTATPSPTPIPFGTGEWLHQNVTVVVPAVVVFVVVLLLILIVALRVSSQRKNKDWSGHLNPLTGVFPAPGLTPGSAANPQSNLAQPVQPMPDQDANLTNIMAYHDPSLTNFIPQMAIPKNQLVIQQSLDQTILGKTVSINHFPFIIGRTADDLQIPNDKNVSRRHAQIIYEDSIFYVEDLGSQLGTIVRVKDNQTVPRGGRLPLESGALIILGTTTSLIFTFDPPNPTADSGNTKY